MLILKNAKILNPDIILKKDSPLSDIIIKGSKICSIALATQSTQQIEDFRSAQIIDLKGKTLCSGFIDAHSHIGMIENAIGFEGDDANEMSDPITPHLRAIDGINPRDLCFREALEQGVTTVLTGPGSANVICGEFATLKTYGDSLEEMIVNPCSFMKIAFGENPKRIYSKKDRTPMTRMASVALLREALQKAKQFEQETSPFDFKSLALQKVVKKLVPLKIHAHRADDILSAIRVAKEFDLDYTLDHCTEGHLILEVLKRHGSKIILGPLMLARFKVEMKNLSQSAPKLFANAKIDFALATDHPEIPQYLLRTTAALCVANGLSENDALKSITINPAKIMGLQQTLGSVESGKDADLIVFDGDVFDIRNNPVLVVGGGKIFVNKLENQG